MFTASSATARPANIPPAWTTDSCVVAKPRGSNHAPASQLRNVARESRTERKGRWVITGVNWWTAPSTPIERVASMARCAAATTRSSVGSTMPTERNQINATPHPTKPSDAAARKLNGTDGGGTALGSPGGRPCHPPAPGDGAVSEATVISTRDTAIRRRPAGGGVGDVTVVDRLAGYVSILRPVLGPEAVHAIT